MSHDFASRERFSDRVSNYVRFRPGYPAEVLDIAADEMTLPSDARVADVGSGTGIFSQLLLDRGYHVWGIEPNAEMRRAAEERIGHHPYFVSIPGSAEATTLPDESVQLVTAAQAFHWFPLEETRREWARILQPPGNVLIVWNDRKRHGSKFLSAYDELLLTYGTDYAALMRSSEEKIAALPDFFNPGTYRTRTLTNSQRFDFPEFVGRVLSSSYIPNERDPRHAAVLQELKRLFNRYNTNGVVEFEYEVTMHLGQVTR